MKFPKPTKQPKRRKRIRWIGKRTQEWIDFRQTLLSSLYASATVAFDNKWVACSVCSKRISMSILNGRIVAPGMELHHIKKRLSHPEQRLDPANIQVLCEWCHREIHAYGNGK